MNQTDFFNLLQHAEREIDKTISSLNDFVINPLTNRDNRRIKSVLNTLYELSLEFNTRINHLKHEASKQ